ncbi:hypothetical protein ASPZODRAFT_52551, partial [Penicilliopsis zonata CBS 506.65]
NGPSWVHESPFLTTGWEDISLSGSASLKHMAMRKTLSDQRNLNAKLFEHVPWRIAEYLWGCLKESRKQTFYMWKVFATAYPHEFRKLSRHREMKIEGPKMPLGKYLGLVKSDSLSWIAVLTVSTQFAKTPELVDIAMIQNLGALKIITPSGLSQHRGPDNPYAAGLSDRIVRAWSELADSSGAFKHLRVLYMVNQVGLSPAMLPYLNSFPSLSQVVFCGCSGIISKSKAQLVSSGW